MMYPCICIGLNIPRTPDVGNHQPWIKNHNDMKPNQLLHLARLLFILVLSLSITGQHLLSQEQFFPIGPAGSHGQTYGGTRVEVSGRTSVIAVNPQNSRDVWLGTATGGVWHSSNAGEIAMSWKPMSDHFSFFFNRGHCSCKLQCGPVQHYLRWHRRMQVAEETLTMAPVCLKLIFLAGSFQDIRCHQSGILKRYFRRRGE